jgi:hypothetical protein
MIDQQQLLAEQLRKYQAQAQAQAPQGRMAGRVYVAPNPLEYLAAGLRGVGGMRGEQQTQQAMGDLAAKRQAAMVEQLRGFGQKMQGTPEVPAADVADGPGQTFTAPAIPAQAGDPMAAYSQLLGSEVPELQKMGMQGMAAMPEMQARQQERVADRTFRADQAAAERQARADQLAATNQARADQLAAAAQARAEQTQMAHQLRMDQLAAQNASAAERAAADREFRAAQLQMQQDFQREMKKIGGAAASQQPYFQPVKTAQGVFAFNARTGRVEPVTGPGGAPIVGAAADPKLQGDITGAKEAAKAGVEKGVEQGKNVKRADMMLSQIDTAENILKSGKPTESGIGAAIDAAGRMVGVSNVGAQESAKLEALSGWLVANVPRMEGPQSNFDVQNYQTMAGKIGDKTVPIKERLAAVDTVKKLQQKYKSLNQDDGAPAAPSAPKRVKYDAQGNPLP